MNEMEFDARIALMTQEIRTLRAELQSMKDWHKKIEKLLDQIGGMMKLDETVIELTKWHGELSERIYKLECHVTGTKPKLHS